MVILVEVFPFYEEMENRVIWDLILEILQPEDFWIRAPRKGIVVFALPGEPGLTELVGDFKVQFHDRQGDFYWSAIFLSHPIFAYIFSMLISFHSLIDILDIRPYKPCCSFLQDYFFC